MNVLRQIWESARFAWQAMKENLLRTTLSLLGVTVGIFAIITSLTIVDSLKISIAGRLEMFGARTVYVTKWPWVFSDNFPWWRYFQRPEPTYREFRQLKQRVETAQAMAIVDRRSGLLAERLNSSLIIFGIGATYDYDRVTTIRLAQGRYFTPAEADGNRNLALIGDDVANTLFAGIDPIGQTFKVEGNRFQVIGVLEKMGRTVLDGSRRPDARMVVPYATYAKLFQGEEASPNIIAQGYPDDDREEALEADIRGTLRSLRGLRPSWDDNFSVNRPDAVNKLFDAIFQTLTVAGWVISAFSILIGGFGIANIMFVSVTERKNIIGVQKSLGAKNYVILLQFLFEATLLSLIGGLAGLLLVYSLTLVPLGTLQLVLTPGNVTFGLSMATLVGVIAGIVPAYGAARLDPVVAIRSK